MRQSRFLAWLRQACGSVIVLTAIALAAGVPGALAESAKPGSEREAAEMLKVTLEEGRLSVEAKDASLRELLSAVADKAGFKLSMAGELDRPVSWRFSDVPLDAAVRRMLRNVSSVMLYGPSDEPGIERLAEVRTFGDDRPQGRYDPDLVRTISASALAQEFVSSVDLVSLAKDQPSGLEALQELAEVWDVSDPNADLFGWPMTQRSFSRGTNLSEVQCLALNIYWEARSEPQAGQAAVAHVTLNRVRDDRYPDSICDVVYQGEPGKRGRCQFSWWCDGSSDLPTERDAWESSLEEALAVLKGERPDPSDGALFFHHHTISPDWSSRVERTARIGKHLYYR